LIQNDQISSQKVPQPQNVLEEESQ